MWENRALRIQAVQHRRCRLPCVSSRNLSTEMRNPFTKTRELCIKRLLFNTQRDDKGLVLMSCGNGLPGLKRVKGKYWMGVNCL